MIPSPSDTSQRPGMQAYVTTIKSTYVHLYLRRSSSRACGYLDNSRSCRSVHVATVEKPVDYSPKEVSIVESCPQPICLDALFHTLSTEFSRFIRTVVNRAQAFFSLSIISFTLASSVGSVCLSCSIFSHACITVVWSRPPNSSPILGNDNSVNSLHKYMAT